MPELSRIYNKFHAKGFTIVGINVDENTDTLNQYLRENKLPFVVLHDQENKAMPSLDVKYYQHRS